MVTSMGVHKTRLVVLLPTVLVMQRAAQHMLAMMTPQLQL